MADNDKKRQMPRFSTALWFKNILDSQQVARCVNISEGGARLEGPPLERPRVVLSVEFPAAHKVLDVIADCVWHCEERGEHGIRFVDPSVEFLKALREHVGIA